MVTTISDSWSIVSQLVLLKL